mmetsp:Transcript_38832/g.97269  ORF Transcript_38832/g.97269 Transcript_38832/m.97269 type:complete len:1100 (+) Transcript_38832:103-3402(+)
MASCASRSAGLYFCLLLVAVAGVAPAGSCEGVNSTILSLDGVAADTAKPLSVSWLGSESGCRSWRIEAGKMVDVQPAGFAAATGSAEDYQEIRLRFDEVAIDQDQVMLEVLAPTNLYLNSVGGNASARISEPTDLVHTFDGFLTVQLRNHSRKEVEARFAALYSHHGARCIASESGAVSMRPLTKGLGTSTWQQACEVTIAPCKIDGSAVTAFTLALQTTSPGTTVEECDDTCDDASKANGTGALDQPGRAFYFTEKDAIRISTPPGARVHGMYSPFTITSGTAWSSKYCSTTREGRCRPIDSKDECDQAGRFFTGSSVSADESTGGEATSNQPYGCSWSNERRSLLWRGIPTTGPCTGPYECLCSCDGREQEASAAHVGQLLFIEAIVYLPASPYDYDGTHFRSAYRRAMARTASLALRANTYPVHASDVTIAAVVSHGPGMRRAEEPVTFVTSIRAYDSVDWEEEERALSALSSQMPRPSQRYEDLRSRAILLLNKYVEEDFSFEGIPLPGVNVSLVRIDGEEFQPGFQQVRDCGGESLFTPLVLYCGFVPLCAFLALFWFPVKILVKTCIGCVSGLFSSLLGLCSSSKEPSSPTTPVAGHHSVHPPSDAIVVDVTNQCQRRQVYLQEPSQSQLSTVEPPTSIAPVGLSAYSAVELSSSSHPAIDFEPESVPQRDAPIVIAQSRAELQQVFPAPAGASIEQSEWAQSSESPKSLDARATGLEEIEVENAEGENAEQAEENKNIGNQVQSVSAVFGVPIRECVQEDEGVQAIQMPASLSRKHMILAASDYTTTGGNDKPSEMVSGSQMGQPKSDNELDSEADTAAWFLALGSLIWEVIRRGLVIYSTLTVAQTLEEQLIPLVYTIDILLLLYFAIRPRYVPGCLYNHMHTLRTGRAFKQKYVSHDQELRAFTGWDKFLMGMQGFAFVFIVGTEFSDTLCNRRLVETLPRPPSASYEYVNAWILYASAILNLQSLIETSPVVLLFFFYFVYSSIRLLFVTFCTPCKAFFAKRRQRRMEARQQAGHDQRSILQRMGSCFSDHYSKENVNDRLVRKASSKVQEIRNNVSVKCGFLYLPNMASAPGGCTYSIWVFLWENMAA